MKVRKIMVAIMSIGFVGTCSQFAIAQLSKWVGKAGASIKTEAGNFADTTKKAGRNISNSFPKLGGGNRNRSTLSQAVGPTMDRNGNIWSGGGNASVGKGKKIGKAKVIHNPKTGKASYFSNYSNIYGTVSPTKRPAPRYDRQPQSHRDIVIEPAKVIQKFLGANHSSIHHLEKSTKQNL